MGMTIRVVYNNQNWAGKCKKADIDERLRKCRDKSIDIGGGEFETDENGNCISVCWECELCTKYCWERSDKKNFGARTEGAAFFVFPDITNNNLFVLFAKSRVKAVDGGRVYFEKFEPMPEKNWVRNLRPIDVSPYERWRQGTYRFIGSEEERYLDEKIEKKREENRLIDGYIKKLTELGKEKGFLTYDEINDILPKNIVSSEQIDRILRGLSEENIEVRESVDKCKKRSKRLRNIAIVAGIIVGAGIVMQSGKARAV